MIKIYYLYKENDGVPIYVGSTKQDLVLRRENHLSDHRGGTPIKKWILDNKVGSGRDIKIKLIEECSLDDRYERESYWIRHYKTKLNIKIGASHTDETKKHLSLKLKGRKMTEEQTEKIREAQKKKIKKLQINGVVFDGVNDAYRKTGISAGYLSRMLNNKIQNKLNASYI
jgi:hypothetical protein